MVSSLFKSWLAPKTGTSRKTVYLHIGISKTGTTAIQKFLNGETENLAAAGVQYLRAGRNTGGESHHRLARIYKAGSCGRGVLENIRQEILGSDCHSFVVSSEMFEYLEARSISRLKRDFSGFRLVLVVYLRYQDQAMSSMYNELVKKHACDLSFSEHVSTTPRKDLLLYGKMLDKWSKALGKENIRARIFEKDRFYNGDLIQDFLNVIDVAGTAFESRSFQKNEAVSSVVVQILSDINRSMSYSVDHAKHYGPACKLSGILTRLIKEQFPEIAGNTNSFFSSESEYNNFIEYYERDNAKISKKYLGGEPFRPSGFVKRAALAEVDKVKVLSALAKRLGLEVEQGVTTSQYYTSEIAGYWSSELQRLCES